MQLFERVTVISLKTKTENETRGIQDQDQDQDSEVPRLRPRPRLEGSNTKTETKTCKNESRDVSRPRLKSWELQVWFKQSASLIDVLQKPGLILTEHIQPLPFPPYALNINEPNSN